MSLTRPLPVSRAALILCSILSLLFAPYLMFAGEPVPARLAVYFSPNGGATAAIVQALADARQTVLVQAYSFTSAPIAQALVEAHRRGVQVQVVLDKSNEKATY